MNVRPLLLLLLVALLTPACVPAPSGGGDDGDDRELSFSEQVEERLRKASPPARGDDECARGCNAFRECRLVPIGGSGAPSIHAFNQGNAPDGVYEECARRCRLVEGEPEQYACVDEAQCDSGKIAACFVTRA